MWGAFREPIKTFLASRHQRRSRERSRRDVVFGSFGTGSSQQQVRPCPLCPESRQVTASQRNDAMGHEQTWPLNARVQGPLCSKTDAVAEPLRWRLRYVAKGQNPDSWWPTQPPEDGLNAALSLMSFVRGVATPAIECIIQRHASLELFEIVIIHP
jgi:hypothetical protein